MLAGVAYFGASVRAESQQFGSSAEERKVPLPVIGARFRIFPFQGDLFNINGELKAMTYGSFGRYLNPNVNAALAVTQHVRVQAGLNLVNANAHSDDGTKAFKIRFAGPIFSVQLHD